MQDKSNDLIFELKAVYFSYLKKFSALCGIDMEIRKGEKLAIIGANGSGKSTLLYLLDGLFFPDQGIVKAFGQELNETIFNDQKFNRDFRRKVGLVFQNPDVQLFCPTVEEELTFGPLQLGVEKAEISKRVDSLVSAFKIEDLLKRSPYQLSIGEKHKVAIASVLAIEPEVLILDEPTSGLDPATCRQIMDILIEANESGKTTIVTTHDLHIVEEVADTVYVFNCQKQIAGFGKSQEILMDKELLENNNLIHIHAHRHQEKLHTHSHQHLDHHQEG